MRCFQILALGSVLAFSACSTSFYPYQGAKPIQGQGGASKTVDGIDLWIEGTPPRKFIIVGVITDGRPGGPIPMAARNAQVAALAKKKGGDAVLLAADERHFVGTAFSANTFTSGQATAVGIPGGISAQGSAISTTSGFAPAIHRRESKYYVIKYL